MRWTVHGERALYESEWVELMLADVEIPGGDRFDHHVVRLPRKASGTVVHDAERGLLLLWRHRFITDTWGWELPAGLIDEGETPEQAAARETLEETGYRPGPLRHLVSYHPTNGLSDQTFHLYLAESATDEGPAVDQSESERVEWVPLDDVRRFVREGQVRDGLSLVGLLWYFAIECGEGG